MEKRKKIKLFKDLYGYTIGICITDDIKRSSNEDDKKLGGEGRWEKQSKALHLYPTDIALSILYFKSDASPGDIAHEAWHAVRRMFEYNEQGLDNETVGYTLGYLTDEISKFLKDGK